MVTFCVVLNFSLLALVFLLFCHCHWYMYSKKPIMHCPSNRHCVVAGVHCVVSLNWCWGPILVGKAAGT
jgi:hypothetical protein